MTRAFSGQGLFNQPLNNWIVNNVTSMEEMFKNCYNFNQDLSGWDLSNILFISNIFNGASNFDSKYTNPWVINESLDISNIFQDGLADISNDNVYYASSNFNKFDVIYKYGEVVNWNTSLITDMSGLFANDSSFNENISGWNVGNVTNMARMFFGSINFNQDISTWSVSNVTSMQNMFNSGNLLIPSNFNQDISSWDVKNVTNIEGMFDNNDTFNQDITNWNTSNINNMTSLFARCANFNQNISKWNTSNVTTMNEMLKEMINFNQPDIFKWDVTKVGSFNNIFNNSSNMLNYADATPSRYQFNLLQNGRFEENTISGEFVNEYYYSNITDLSGWIISNSGSSIVNVIDASNIINDSSYNINKWQIEMSGNESSLYQNIILDISGIGSGRFNLIFYFSGDINVTLSGDNYIRENNISSINNYWAENEIKYDLYDGNYQLIFKNNDISNNLYLDNVSLVYSGEYEHEKELNQNQNLNQN